MIAQYSINIKMLVILAVSVYLSCKYTGYQGINRVIITINM